MKEAGTLISESGTEMISSVFFGGGKHHFTSISLQLLFLPNHEFQFRGSHSRVVLHSILATVRRRTVDRATEDHCIIRAMFHFNVPKFGLGCGVFLIWGVVWLSFSLIFSFSSSSFFFSKF